MLWHGFGGNLHRLCCTWHNERNSLENSYYFHIIAFSEIVFMLLVVSNREQQHPRTTASENIIQQL